MACYSYVLWNPFVGVSLIMESRFPFDSPDTPPGMEIISKLYSSPYGPVVAANARITRNALVYCMEIALEAGSAGPLVPVAMGKKIKTDHCFHLVSLRIKGRGSIKVPCAVSKKSRDEE